MSTSRTLPTGRLTVSLAALGLTTAFLAGCSTSTAGAPVSTATALTTTAQTTSATPTATTTTPTPSTEQQIYDVPTGPDDVVISVSWAGGLVPVDYFLTFISSFVLLGDGTLISSAPQTPSGDPDNQPPSYPHANFLTPLQATQLTPQQVQELLQRADSVGLLGEVDFGGTNVMDAGSAFVDITVGGETFQHSAPALGISDDEPNDVIDAAEVKARKDLGEFIDEVHRLAESNPVPYQPKSIVVNRMNIDGAAYLPEKKIHTVAAKWPLSEVPESPKDSKRLTCVVVTGEDARVLADALATAEPNTSWTAGDEELDWVIFRPLLPGDPECDQP